MAIAKPELMLKRSELTTGWKESLSLLESICIENISTLQTVLSTTMIKSKKKKVLIKSFLIVEINNLNFVKELQSCKCIESASELWAGRYQFRYQYNKDDRYRNSPINISIG